MTITTEDISKSFGVSRATIVNKLGCNWGDFLREIEEPIKRKYTKKSLIKIYQDLKKKIGKVPSKSDLRKHHIDVKAYNREFGSWQKFKDTQGDYDKKITKEDVIDCMLKFKEEHGRFPHLSDIKKYNLYSVNTLTKLFGSFNKTIIACGGVPRKVGHRFNKKVRA